MKNQRLARALLLTGSFLCLVCGPGCRATAERELEQEQEQELERRFAEFVDRYADESEPSADDDADSSTSPEEVAEERLRLALSGDLRVLRGLVLFRGALLRFEQPDDERWRERWQERYGDEPQEIAALEDGDDTGVVPYEVSSLSDVIRALRTGAAIEAHLLDVVSEWVAANRESLELMRLLIERGEIDGLASFAEDPDAVTGFDLMTGGFHLLELLAAETALALRDDAPLDVVVEQLGQRARFAQLVLRPRVHVMWGMVGLSWAQTVLVSVDRLVHNPGVDLTARQLSRLLSAVRPLDLAVESAAQQYRGELSFFLLPALAREDLRADDYFVQESGALEYILADHSRPYDRVATARLFAGEYQRLIEHCVMPWREPAHSPQLLIAADLDETLTTITGSFSVGTAEIDALRDRMHAVDNPVGLWSVHSALSMVTPSVGRAFLMHARHSLTVALLAVHVYLAEHGELPADLQLLVRDGILPEVPLDPYTGEPVGYSPERVVLWCVGEDRVSHEGDADEGDDEILKIFGK